MMNLQSRPIVLQYDYGFGRRSLLGTLGSWIGCSLPIDLISFNLQMIPREPQGERLMAPPSLVSSCSGSRFHSPCLPRRLS